MADAAKQCPHIWVEELVLQTYLFAGFPRALNALLGTKFKLVSGFPSSSDVMLAIERSSQAQRAEAARRQDVQVVEVADDHSGLVDAGHGGQEVGEERGQRGRRDGAPRVQE